MAAKTVSLEEFKNNAEEISAASADGPVFITRPGRNTLVVLDIEEYWLLDRRDVGAMTRAHEALSLVDLLGMPEGVGEIEFDPPPFVGPYNPNREVDLSD